MNDLGDYVREHKRTTSSIEDQISISHAMYEEGVGPSHDGVKASDLQEELGIELDYEVRTSLKHLEDIDIVEEFTPPGPDTLVIAAWKDDGEGEVVNGSVDEAAREGLQAIIEQLDERAEGGAEAAADGSGTTLRSVLTRKFDLVPEKVEEFLHGTSDPVDTLNRAVKAVDEADGVEKTAEYGEIFFINMPYRYRLTERAVGLIES